MSSIYFFFNIRHVKYIYIFHCLVFRCIKLLIQLLFRDINMVQTY